MAELDVVFAYGTLQFDEVMEAVTGRRFPGVPAALADHRRSRLIDRTYPGIAPHDGMQVEGCLFRGVDTASLAALDVFESEIYDRLTLEIATGAERVEAWTYVVAPRYRHLLSEHPWEPEEFMLEHGQAFIESCKRFRSEGVV